MIGKRCLVGGRVQGVFYRATIAQHARVLGVKGHAINLPDGRVDVLAYGEPQVLQAFIEFLWKGSSASKVTSEDVTDADAAQCPTEFRTG